MHHYYFISTPATCTMVASYNGLLLVSYIAAHTNLPMYTKVIPCFDVWLACKLI